MSSLVWLDHHLIFEKVELIYINLPDDRDDTPYYSNMEKATFNTAYTRDPGLTKDLLHTCMRDPRESHYIKLVTSQRKIIFNDIVITQVLVNFGDPAAPPWFNISFRYHWLSNFEITKNEEFKEKACNFRQIVICRNLNKIKNHNLTERPVMLR